MRLFVLLFSILLLIGCSDNNLKEELINTKEELANLKEEYKDVQSQLGSVSSDLHSNQQEFPLVHVVYFKLKPNADQDALIEEINKLRGIEELHDLEIGIFENLEDQRALSDYQLMMSMAFKNEEDYKSYQAHKLHLGLKEKVGAYLAGPPATYDYLVK